VTRCREERSESALWTASKYHFCTVNQHNSHHRPLFSYPTRYCSAQRKLTVSGLWTSKRFLPFRQSFVAYGHTLQSICRHALSQHLWRSIIRRLVDRHTMSSNSNSSSSSPPRVPPHIRLNSGQEDLLSNDNLRQPAAGTSRSLIPPAGPTRTHSSQNQLYNAPLIQDSQERLLPPNRSKSHRLREDDSPIKSPDRSGFSSRRTSWSSERSRDSRGYENPFSDSRGPSRADSRADSDDENVNTQTVSEKYNILPSAGLLLFPEDVEKDDYLHNPDPNGKEDRDCDIFTRRGMINVGGLSLLTIGLLILFIGYPVL
jgi:Beta-glucan synthesis-associated protein SKN1/KRE6/Sbg1